MKACRAMGILFASLLVASCAADPVSYAAFGLAGAIASGVSRTVDASQSPEERIRHRLPPNCSRFKMRGGSMQCVAYYPRVPSPFAIRPRQPIRQPATSAPVGIDQSYAECLFETHVEKRGSPTGCK